MMKFKIVTPNHVFDPPARAKKVVKSPVTGTKALAAKVAAKRAERQTRKETEAQAMEALAALSGSGEMDLTAAFEAMGASGTNPIEAVQTLLAKGKATTDDTVDA